MEISHEVPRALLKQSLKFNDYQYALPHLLESDEEYRKHFLKCRDEGIPIYLDNSLHELGYAMDKEILLKWVNILKPKIFFIPDVWEDVYKTVELAGYWTQMKLPKETTPVAIVQAKSYSEAKNSIINYKSLGYEYFAFSYGSEYYSNEVPHPNKDMAKALGRISVISRLASEKILTNKDKVHLLGCSVPQEFGWYKGMDFIKSLDTSNPIMAALEGNDYNGSGLHVKPFKNLNSHFDCDIDNQLPKYLVDYNVRMFRIINDL